MSEQDALDHELVAKMLLEAYEHSVRLAPLTDAQPGFGMDAAYSVLEHISERRQAMGWTMVGRKIGFTNTTIWELFNVDRPMWAPMWDATQLPVEDRRAKCSLDALVQPRIEPEVVFGLSGPILVEDREHVDPERVLAGVEWMAAGFEIVQCLYPDWRFTIADCTAAFGLHGAMAVGPRVPVDDSNRASIAAALPDLAVTLSRDGEVVDRGVGANALGSPALALSHLARVVADRPSAPPLAAGEVITTGTITNAWSVSSGETWTSNYDGLGLLGLTITFS